MIIMSDILASCQPVIQAAGGPLGRSPNSLISALASRTDKYHHTNLYPYKERNNSTMLVNMNTSHIPLQPHKKVNSVGTDATRNTGQSHSAKMAQNDPSQQGKTWLSR